MKHLHLYTSFSLPTCHDEQGNKINEPTNKNSFPPVYSSWSLLKIYFCPVNLMAITSLNTVRVIFLDAKQPGWNRLVSPSEGDQFIRPVLHMSAFTSHRRGKDKDTSSCSACRRSVFCVYILQWTENTWLPSHILYFPEFKMFNWGN